MAVISRAQNRPAFSPAMKQSTADFQDFCISIQKKKIEKKIHNSFNKMRDWQYFESTVMQRISCMKTPTEIRQRKWTILINSTRTRFAIINLSGGAIDIGARFLRAGKKKKIPCRRYNE